MIKGFFFYIIFFLKKKENCSYYVEGKAFATRVVVVVDK